MLINSLSNNNRLKGAKNDQYVVQINQSTMLNINGTICQGLYRINPIIETKDRSNEKKYDNIHKKIVQILITSIYNLINQYKKQRNVCNSNFLKTK